MSALLVRRSSDMTLTVGVVFTAAVVGWLLCAPSGARLAIAAIAVLVAVSAAALLQGRTLVLIAVWLVGLGFLRRVTTTIVGSSHLDPLLVVGPVALATLAFFARARPAAERSTNLGRAVAALAAVAVLEAGNPAQGGATVGLAGLMFVAVPLSGYWIGRRYCDDRLMRSVLKTVALLAIPAAAYGLYQTFFGLPSWDQAWVDASPTYRALNVGGTLRAFGSFSSSAEYAYFMATALVLSVLMFLPGRHRLAATAAIAVLGAALIYESTRTTVIAAFLALVVAVGIRARLSVWMIAGAGVVAVLALSVGAAYLLPSAGAGQSVLLSHQLGGLADPLNSNVSSLPVHLQLIKDGIKSAFTNPLGLGTGVVTIAGTRLGGAGWSTEADPSNAAIAMGLPGLLAYLAVLFFGLRTAYRKARARGDALALAAFAILIVTLFQWLNGGQYAVAYLPWLALGWADRDDVGDDRA